MIENWVAEEFTTLDLGDVCLNRRAKQFVSQAAGQINRNRSSGDFSCCVGEGLSTNGTYFSLMQRICASAATR